MAKDSSFDVVSEVNMQEVDNAYQQCAREITQRYDLKDSGATIDLSKGDKLFTIVAPADFVARQITDVLNSKLIKRGIDLKSISVTLSTPRASASWPTAVPTSSRSVSAAVPSALPARPRVSAVARPPR